MKVEDFVGAIGTDFYTGVPDSLLSPLCDYLFNNYGVDGKHHVVAANEGNAVGIAAGYYMATGRVPVVYMQNSGEGNAINPIASLLNEKVYAIPCIFVIGWRGEPGVKDEPQHVYQGEVTTKLLDVMGIDYCVVGKNTAAAEMASQMQVFSQELQDGRDVAFVIEKGALEYSHTASYQNQYTLLREEVIRHIVEAAGEDIIVCTTGKAGRELYEIREQNGQGHERDFLTVGSMGHASSIALGIALHTEKKVWCIDGDGAMLMHMGALGVIGSRKPKNYVHVILDNSAHESVGGMPTVTSGMNVCDVGKACGYEACSCVTTYNELSDALLQVKRQNQLSLIEVKCKIGSRSDLGRPQSTPVENRRCFGEYLRISL